MTAPYHSKSRHEDLAPSAAKTANFTAEPGIIHPIDLSAASGDIVCSFPTDVLRTYRIGAVFGVIVTGTHATHRLTFDADGETVAGIDLATVEMGSKAGELIAFQLIGDVWYPVNLQSLPGPRTELVETVNTTNVIAAAETGTTYFLHNNSGFASTLPLPAAGLRFTFLVAVAPSGGSYTIVSAGGANIIKGHVCSSDLNAASDGDVETSGGDTITLVDGKAVAGDRVDLIADGTNWYVVGSCAAFDAITITTAS